MAKPPEPDRIIYSMIRVSRSHEKRRVLKDITLSYFYGAKIGVLGLNGSGKSTLLRILAGVDRDFEGRTVLEPGFTIGALEQEPLLGEGRTVREVVEEGVGELIELLREYDELAERLGEPLDADEMQAVLDRQGDVQEQIERQGGWELDSRLRMALDALRCPPDDMPVDRLSGGERRRVALCRLLLRTPDILLLDEPTNHLDAESVAWLEQHLQRYEGTVIAVTHDRYFLDNVAGWILELDRGEGIPWKGNYSSWLEQKSRRLAVEEKQASLRRRTLERELEWVRQSPRGRQAKSKSRVKAYERLLEQDDRQRERELELFIPPGPRLGDLVIEADGVSKAYGDRLLFEDMTFSLPPGGIIGVVGANGAGKTTLFRMITGQEQPDLRRAVARRAAGRQVRLAGDQRRRRGAGAWSRHDEQPGLRGAIRLHRLGSAEARRSALRRRAQPRAPGPHHPQRGQRAAARRADQRPRREHDAGPGGRAGVLRRLRRDHLPRPVVPRPRGDPHPGVRG
jgi:ATP-binding cassette ChvD family protein